MAAISAISAKVVARYEPGMPYGEAYWLDVPNQLTPQLQRFAHHPFFHGFWSDVPGVRGMVAPYSFPSDIMPLQDCAALAAYLITSTAQLEAWSSRRQAIGGPVQLVTITQADGVRWITPDHAPS